MKTELTSDGQAGRVGIGIIGAGNIAAAHAYAAQNSAAGQLVGVASRNHASAVKAAEKYGTKAYPSVKSLLADDEVQVVAICTPSGAHLEPALEAIAAGKHVIVEKPLEVTVERAELIARAAADSGVALATIFMSRFATANMFVKESIDRGELGKLVQGNAYVPWYRSQEYYASAAWRGTKALDGGGALMNQAIHQVDLLLWMMGPVAELFAYAGRLVHTDIEVEDTLVASIRFRNGALGQITAATSLWPGRPKNLELYGTDGMAVLKDDVLAEWANRAHDETARAAVLAEYGGEATGGSSNPMDISFENHRRQYDEFLSSLQAGTPSKLGGREGVKAVELIAAIYRSAETGRSVQLSAED